MVIEIYLIPPAWLSAVILPYQFSLVLSEADGGQSDMWWVSGSTWNRNSNYIAAARSLNLSIPYWGFFLVYVDIFGGFF